MKTKTFQGLTFKIDRPKGTVKRWPQPSGKDKVFVYPVDYGYFPGLKGEDGEGLDAFVGDAPEGHLEAFQKLKPDEDGRLVLDETKFLVGVTDAQREAIYRLYGPEVWARRVFHDVNDVREAAQRFGRSKKERYREKTAEAEDENHDVRNAATLAAGVSPFLGMIGQKRIIHDPTTNAAIKRMTHQELAALAQPGDILATNRAKYSPYKPPQKMMTGSDFYHIEPVVGRRNGAGFSLEAGRVFGMGGAKGDKVLNARQLRRARERYGHALNFEDMVLLRPKQPMSPADLRTYVNGVTQGSAAKYNKAEAVKTWLHDVFVPKLGKGRTTVKPNCVAGVCSTVPAKALGAIQRDVLGGKGTSTLTPADFLRSDKYEALGAALTNELKPSLGRKLMPYASRAALGTLLAGGVAGAAYGGSKLYSYLKRPDEEPKQAGTPGTNVHQDQGVYRFNHTAESDAIQDRLQRVWAAHDRRPGATGDESAQGVTFQEGVVG